MRAYNTHGGLVKPKKPSELVAQETEEKEKAKAKGEKVTETRTVTIVQATPTFPTEMNATMSHHSS